MINSYDARAARESKNLTQSELAEKSGLSLRTIQRIEAGHSPKGFTLTSYAKALDLPTEQVVSKNPEIDVSHLKLINISALSFVILPFGNVIIPAILLRKTTNAATSELGKNLVSIQIIWCLVVSVILLATPFVQSLIDLPFPLLIAFLIPAICINMAIILVNGMSLSRHSTLRIKLTNSIL